MRLFVFRIWWGCVCVFLSQVVVMALLALKMLRSENKAPYPAIPNQQKFSQVLRELRGEDLLPECMHACTCIP
jgi:hypothetical protein